MVTMGGGGRQALVLIHPARRRGSVVRMRGWLCPRVSPGATKSRRHQGGSKLGAAEPRDKMFHLAFCQMKFIRDRAEWRG